MPDRKKSSVRKNKSVPRISGSADKKVAYRKKTSDEKYEVSPKRKIKTTADDKLNTVNPSGKKEHSFFELVYEIARQIPHGRVTSYGAIAAVLGTKLSARMVGWAMNGAHHAHPPVPAHRVVNRVGLLSGKFHFKPPEKMEKLLKKEGVLVKDDVIVNFKEKFWDPGTEAL